MFAALFVAALASAPLQANNIVRDVVTNVCLPFADGAGDRAAAEALGFVVLSEEGRVTEMATAEAQPRYLLRLTGDDGETDGEVARVCLLQARTLNFETTRNAVRSPLEQAGFIAEAGQPDDRPVWTRGNVTVSVRQNEGRATMVRVTYSSFEN